MKKFLAIACLFASVSSFAATVKITSFNSIRTSPEAFYSPLAELCGLVEGAVEGNTFVNVVVDHKSNRPGYYNTFAAPNGKFCLAVITYRGTAEATVEGQTVSAKIK